MPLDAHGRRVKPFESFRLPLHPYRNICVALLRA